MKKKNNYVINPLLKDRLDRMFPLVEVFGWKKWGGFKKKDGSSYQCFRKGNRYIWVGYTYIQSNNNDVIQYAKFTDLETNQYINVDDVRKLLQQK